jgi:hypothetical protein
MTIRRANRNIKHLNKYSPLLVLEVMRFFETNYEKRYNVNSLVFNLGQASEVNFICSFKNLSMPQEI